MLEAFAEVAVHFTTGTAIWGNQRLRC